jgi:hypothetical protein
MLFLNWFVIFKSKQNYVTTYNKQVLLKFSLRGYFFTNNLNSPLIAKTTTIILILFFFFNNYFGEYFIFILFDSVSTYDSILMNSNTSYNYFLNNDNFFLSKETTLNFSFFIIVSFISGLRYLKLIGTR